jgi:hypothetical protein
MSWGTALFSTAADWFSNEQRNRRQQESQEQSQDFSARQFATRYQNTVEDMKKAGLNPMLAYSQGGGSPPSSSAAQMTAADSGGKMNQGLTAGSTAALQRAQTELIESQVDVQHATAENIRADTISKRGVPGVQESEIMRNKSSAAQATSSVNYLEFQAKKIAEELKNIPKEGFRIDAMTNNLYAAIDKMNQENLTETERTRYMQELARKTFNEADLTMLDVKAAMQLENIGREFGQLKPFIDTLLRLIRR